MKDLSRPTIDIPTLKFRKVRGDMIETFKILTNISMTKMYLVSAFLGS